MLTHANCHQVLVDLGDRSYTIQIGEGIVSDAAMLEPLMPARQIMIVTNETIAPLYLDTLIKALDGKKVATCVLPDGEHAKRLETMMPVFDQLLAEGFDRDCCIVALGGGVIGDLAGFVAASYQRGVAFVQIPTTLLAMVDSSVGGKTGVNHPHGKNMIGAFHQPSAVIADLDLLKSLPDREFRAGMAEVIKYALLGDYSFLEWLETHLDAIFARDISALIEIVERSCQSKATIVQADEKEAGQRALLNLGHTFGHAIEGATGYSSWLHGEAIGAGMCMAARMSARLGWISSAEQERAIALIQRTGLPTHAPAQITPETLLAFMRRDKKNRDGKLRLVLLRGLGHAIVTTDYSESALMETLQEASHG